MSGLPDHDGSQAANLRTIVRVLLNVGSRKALLDTLDCDAYTADGDMRALEGLGWQPCLLTTDERIAIHLRLSDLEAAEKEAGS